MDNLKDLQSLKDQEKNLNYFKEQLMNSTPAESPDQEKSIPQQFTPSYEDEVKGDKNSRIDLDKALQSLKNLTPSRERSLAVTKVQEGIMWLGMDLKRLGEANPYPDSYNSNNTNIAPTADGLKL